MTNISRRQDSSGSQAAAQLLFTKQFRNGDVGALSRVDRWHYNRLTTEREDLLKAVKDAKPNTNKNSRLFDERQWPRLTEIEAVRIAFNNDRVVLEEAIRRACNDDPELCKRIDPEPQVRSKASILADTARAESARTLRMLTTLTTGLAKIPGRKTIVLMSEGFLAEDEWPLVAETVTLAARANARIYTLDARGLERGLPSVFDNAPADSGTRLLEQMDFGADSINSLAVDSGWIRCSEHESVRPGDCPHCRRRRQLLLTGHPSIRATRWKVSSDSCEGHSSRCIGPRSTWLRRRFLALPQRKRRRRHVAKRQPRRPNRQPSSKSRHPLPLRLPRRCRSKARWCHVSNRPPVFASVLTPMRTPRRLRPAAPPKTQTPPPAGGLPTRRCRNCARAPGGGCDPERCRRLGALHARNVRITRFAAFTRGGSRLGNTSAARPWISEPVALRSRRHLLTAERARRSDSYRSRRAGLRWPRDPELSNALGVIQTARGSLDDAVKSFQSAVAVAPTDATGYFNLGKRSSYGISGPDATCSSFAAGYRTNRTAPMPRRITSATLSSAVCTSDAAREGWSG